MMNMARFQPVVLGLLYHISIEDKFKSLFTYTECIPRIYEMLMRVTVRGGMGAGWSSAGGDDAGRCSLLLTPGWCACLT